MIKRLPYWRHALAVRELTYGIRRNAALMAVCLVMLAAWMSSGNAKAAADVPSPSPGATSPAAHSGAPERAAARRQIEQQRRNLDAAYARQQSSCQRQFFVNDCLKNASRRYRSATETLDEQLNALDLAERKRRAAAERARVERHLRERQGPDTQSIQKRRAGLEQKQADKQRRRARRLEQDAAHEAAYAAKQEQVSKRLQRSPQSHTRLRSGAPASPGHASGAEAAYAAKLADYQRRQRDAARRAQQKAPAPPLPLPPGY